MRMRWIAVLVPCLSAPAVAQNASAVPAAFREQAAAYAAAINNRDAEAIASLYASNGDQVIVDGPRLTGRAAIREVTQKDLAVWPPTRRFTLAVTGARMLTPNIAIVETRATFSDGPVQSNRGTAVMVRHGGKWLIEALRVYPAPSARQ